MASSVGWGDSGFPIFMRVMYIAILGILVSFGILGNVISFFVFRTQAKEKKNTGILLFQWLAVADVTYLFSSVFSRLLPTVAKYVHPHIKTLETFIYIRPYTTAFASMSQTWACYMMVLVSAQRYMVIANPIKWQGSFYKVRNIHIAVAIIIFASIAYNLPKVFQSHVKIMFNRNLNLSIATVQRTKFGKHPLYLILYQTAMTFILRRIIPVVCVLYCNIKLVKLLQKSKKEAKKLGMFHNDAAKRVVHEDTLVIVLIALCITFQIFNWPVVISSTIRIINMIGNFKSPVLKAFREYFVVVANMLLSANSATNFFVYLICGTSFRRTIKKMLKCSHSMHRKEKTGLQNKTHIQFLEEETQGIHIQAARSVSTSASTDL